MVDYHPTLVFMQAISSDVGLNYNTSDATVVTIHGNIDELTVSKSSDYHYNMNEHIVMSFTELCCDGPNTNRTQGYIQRKMIESSGAFKVSLCMSSDTITAYYLWNNPITL